MLNYLRDLSKTLYSKPFYANLLRNGKGIGAGFILAQVILLVLPILIVDAAYLIGREKYEDAQKVTKIFDSLPAITIKNAKLSIDKESPYLVELYNVEKEGSLYLKFDTSSRKRDINTVVNEFKAERLAALVTAGYTAYQGNDSKIEFITYQENKTDKNKPWISIDHEKWVSIGKAALTWAIPVSLVLMCPLLFIGLFITTFFKALLIKFAALFISFKPDVSCAMRLCAAATIPASLLSLLIKVTGGNLPVLISLLIWLGYSIFGLRSAMQASPQDSSTK